MLLNKEVICWAALVNIYNRLNLPLILHDGYKVFPHKILQSPLYKAFSLNPTHEMYWAVYGFDV